MRRSGGIRHAGPAPAPCGEGYASPLTRARGAWRTETPVVPRFSRGKGFRPLDNGCFLCCLFVCFPVCVLIVWLVLCLLVSVFLGCLFLFSFVCSVGFGRSVWLVLCLFVLLSVRLVLLVLVVLSGLYCFVGLAVCCVRVCLVCVSAMVSGLCVLAFPSGRVVLFSLLCGLVLFSFPSLSFSRLLFSASPFCLRRLAPCGRRAPRAARGPSLFPLSSLIVVRVPGGG